MTVGVIKWYDEARGFGFIVNPEGLEVYFHYTAIADAQKLMASGHSVSFDLIETRMGFEAANVRRMSY